MDTRTQLLDHAEAVVRARGFDGFSYADLAATVGIRKPSIHHHFPRKADLALALIERYVARLFAGLEALGAQEPRAGARLHALVGSYREGLDGGSKLCLCVALAVGRDSLDPAVIAGVNAFHEQVVDWLAACFVQGAADGSVRAVGDPRTEAHAALALMEGAQLVARAAGRLELFDAATAGLRERLA